MGWLGVLGGVAHGATEEFKRHEDLEGKIRIAAAKKSDTGLATLQKEVAKLGGEVNLTDTRMELLAKLKQLTIANKHTENLVSMSDINKDLEAAGGKAYWAIPQNDGERPANVLFTSDSVFHKEYMPEKIEDRKPKNYAEAFMRRLNEISTTMANPKNKAVVANNPMMLEQLVNKYLRPLLRNIDDSTINTPQFISQARGAGAYLFDDPDHRAIVESLINQETSVINNNTSGGYFRSTNQLALNAGLIKEDELQYALVPDQNKNPKSDDVHVRSPEVINREAPGINNLLSQETLASFNPLERFILIARDPKNRNNLAIKHLVGDNVIQGQTLDGQPTEIIQYGLASIGDAISDYVDQNGSATSVAKLNTVLVKARPKLQEDLKGVNIYKIAEKMYAEDSPFQPRIVYHKGLGFGKNNAIPFKQEPTRSKEELEEVEGEKKTMGRLRDNHVVMNNILKMTTGIEDVLILTGISTAIGKEGAAGELELTPEVMEAFMGVSQLVPRTSIRKDRSGNVTVSATAVQTALIEALRGGDLSQQSQDLFKQLGGEATATGGVGFRRFFNNLFTNISSITQAAEDIYDENMDVFNKNTGPLKFVFDKKEEIINPATSFDGGYLNIKSTVSGKEVRNIFQAEENKLNMARRRMREASTQKGPEATRAWLRAYAAAQLSYFKINLAYQYASYIQGGAAARTVSDADFLNNFRALFQQEGTGLIAVVNEISDQITQEEKLTRALLTKDRRNIGRVKHIEASFRSLSTARLRDSRRKRQQEILQSLERNNRITPNHPDNSRRNIKGTSAEEYVSGDNIGHNQLRAIRSKDAFNEPKGDKNTPVRKVTLEGKTSIFNIDTQFPSTIDSTQNPAEARKFQQGQSTVVDDTARKLNRYMRNKHDFIGKFNQETINKHIYTLNNALYSPNEDKDIADNVAALFKHLRVTNPQGWQIGGETGGNLFLILERFRDEKLFKKIYDFEQAIKKDPNINKSKYMQKNGITSLDLHYDQVLDSTRNIILRTLESVQ